MKTAAAVWEVFPIQTLLLSCHVRHGQSHVTVETKTSKWDRKFHSTDWSSSHLVYLRDIAREQRTSEEVKLSPQKVEIHFRPPENLKQIFSCVGWNLTENLQFLSIHFLSAFSALFCRL